MISAEENAKRLKAVQYATAIEGVPPSEETKQLLSQWVDGDISLKVALL